MQYCEANEKLEPEGYCSECGEFTYPGSSDPDSIIKKQCITDECTFTQYLTTSGRCKDCEVYSHSTDDGKSCTKDSCDFVTQITLKNGTCHDCPAGFTPSLFDDDNYKCVADDGSFNKISDGAGGLKDCDPGFIADIAGVECIKIECEDD